MRDFELTYAAYAEFQRGMERYWCLRALLQDGRKMAIATVVKESLVVLDDMPLFVRLPSLPALNRGVRVRPSSQESICFHPIHNPRSSGWSPS